MCEKIKSIFLFFIIFNNFIIKNGCKIIIIINSIKRFIFLNCKGDFPPGHSSNEALIKIDLKKSKIIFSNGYEYITKRKKGGEEEANFDSYGGFRTDGGLESDPEDLGDQPGRLGRQRKAQQNRSHGRPHERRLFDQQVLARAGLRDQ